MQITRKSVSISDTAGSDERSVSGENSGAILTASLPERRSIEWVGWSNGSDGRMGRMVGWIEWVGWSDGRMVGWSDGSGTLDSALGDMTSAGTSDSESQGAPATIYDIIESENRTAIKNPDGAYIRRL